MAHALLFGGHHIARQHWQHRAVHGHRDRHFVERNLVEQDLHVFDRVNRHTGLAHIARHAGVVRVVAAVGGQIKRHRHTLTACGQSFAIKRVGFFGGGKACVLANRPGAHRIHGGLRSTQKGLKTRQRVGIWQVLGVFCGVQRFDADAVWGLPVERGHIAVGGRLGSSLGPGFEVGGVEFVRLVAFVLTHGKLTLYIGTMGID